jgi:histidine triad (HIT) family protein
MPDAYDPQNIFAKILRGEIPCHKVYEDEHTLAFMDIMPRNDGHVLVIPKTPARNLLDVSEEALAAVMRTVRLIAPAAQAAFEADGVLLQQLSEEAAGQEVFHLHFHIVPRHKDRPLRERKMADHAVLAEQAAQIRALLPS